MTTEQRLKCKEIIKEAGRRLLSMHATQIEEKTDWKNLVTSCDKETQEFLIAKLSEVDPEATFLCEENELYDISGEHMFIIDPIDGTSNFIHDFQLSCISVAYATRETVLWGMIFNPYMNEFYEAWPGGGSYLNGRKIHISNEPLQQNLVLFGTSPYYDEWQNETFELARFVKEYCIDLRRSGSAAIDCCYTAAGRSGLYYERWLQPWDFAAGKCIIQEAGGLILNFEHQTPDHTRPAGVVMGSPENVERFFELYAEFKEKQKAGLYKFSDKTGKR